MTIDPPSLLRSKKFGAAALASILSLVGLNYGLTLEQVGVVTAPLYVFIGAQGIADIGKEKAKATVSTTHATISCAPINPEQKP